MKTMIIFSIFAAAVVYAQKYDDETTTSTIPPLTTEKPPDFKCYKPGLTCQDCGTLVNCVQADDELIPHVVSKCNTSGGEYCLTNECSMQPNPVCANQNYKFRCTSLGVFPDPFDCKKYHYCIKDPTTNKLQDPFTYTCKGDYGYDPVTTYCKNKLPDGCKGVAPVPSCTKAGQSGALVNKSIYYFCIQGDDKKLYPELYICPNGQIYDKVCK